MSARVAVFVGPGVKLASFASRLGLALPAEGIDPVFESMPAPSAALEPSASALVLGVLVLAPGMKAARVVLARLGEQSALRGRPTVLAVPRLTAQTKARLERDFACRAVSLDEGEQALARACRESLEAEAHQAGSTVMLGSILANAPDLVFVADRDGIVRFVNREDPVAGACRLVGTGAWKHVGTSQAAVQRMIAEALAGRSSSKLTFSVARPDGERWYAARLFPLGSSSTHVIGRVSDITDRRRTEIELERAAQKIAESQAQTAQAQRFEALGQLAGSVAHDFNNLLTTILSFTRFVIEDLAADDPRRADLVEVLKAADSATRLTQQLLAFSRSRPVEPQQIELNAAVNSVARILGRLVGESVEVELEPAPHPVWTLIDPGQLDQLLMNLATNARDAMPEGGKLRIKLGSRELDEHALLPAGRYVQIIVSDTGVGMTKEAQLRAFEPFFTTKGERGTGLGLATCYGIVKQAGGHVEVQSEPDHGAIFTLTLPNVDADPRAATRLQTSGAPKVVRMQGLALVVEDHAAVRRTMTRSLSEAGMQVLEAGTAEEALALVEDLQARIDVLVTDVVLPGKGGIQLAETMRANQEGLRVLVCSGYVGDANSDSVQRLAGTDFLQKPFTGLQLVSKVAAMFD